MKICSNCVMLETRPRVTFDENNVCNACQWSKEKKQKVDWKLRANQLNELVEKYKKRNAGRFDCICPSSGGKDSSYVAYKLKELGLHPLTVTINPPLPHEIGERNFNNFLGKGFDNIRITPNYEVGRKLAKKAFLEQGRPMHAFIMAVQTAIFRTAVLFDIPFVMFGEEGETEYGGTIGDNCHLAVGAVLAGEVEVGEKSFIGANATITNCVKVAPESFIKACERVK